LWVIDFYRMSSYVYIAKSRLEMSRIGTKYKKAIELFDEKTGSVVRVIRFRNFISFDEFLKDFEAMRYPGYSWRYVDKSKRR